MNPNERVWEDEDDMNFDNDFGMDFGCNKGVIR